MPQKAGGAGAKKYSKGRRKSEGKARPLSLFVRNKISAKNYWEMTNQSLRNAVKDSAD